MKILYFLILMTTITHSQVKIDTIYSGKEVDGIYTSKMELILNQINTDCNKKDTLNSKLFIENNNEFKIMSNLHQMAVKSKSNIFSEFKTFICATFCDANDFELSVYLYEIHYENTKKAEECIQTLSKLENDDTFWESIGTKNWFFRRDGKNVYFLMSNLDDIQNPIKKEIENKLKIIISN
jgi:hypothetical protein